MKKTRILIAGAVMIMAWGTGNMRAQEPVLPPTTPQTEAVPDTMHQKEKPEAQQPATQQMQQAQEVPQSVLSVDKIACGTDVVERELQGEAQTFPDSVGKIYCWTVITGAEEPETIEHVWYHDGEEVARVPLEIKYPHMRTWSSKNMIPEWSGPWKVEVVDGKGNVLATTEFTLE